VPLVAWSSLVGALGLVLMLPVVFGNVIYLFVDLRLGLGEEGKFGSAEGLGDWLSWPFSVPAVFVYAIPAIGVAAELFPVAFKQRQVLRGVAFAALSLVGVAALAATTQQYLFPVQFDTSGETFVRDAVVFVLFAGFPLLGVTLTLLLGLATAKAGAGNGRPRISAPFVFSLLGLFMIGAGIAGHVLLAIVDLELVDPATGIVTVFEEGAVLYVAYGTALAVMGGVIYWAPKLWGRLLPDKQTLPLALLGLAATVLASLPLYVAGFLDQVGGIPADDADVAAMLSLDGIDGGSLWIVLSLIGHGLMALTVIAFAGLMLKTFTGRGDAADENPYGGHTIEWSTPSPAPAHNYEHVPTVTSPEPLLDQTDEGSQS
jgi:heme/copper-type cytochrome/quinol oxidase subunit 1